MTPTKYVSIKREAHDPSEYRVVVRTISEQKVNEFILSKDVFSKEIAESQAREIAQKSKNTVFVLSYDEIPPVVPAVVPVRAPSPDSEYDFCND